MAVIVRVPTGQMRRLPLRRARRDTVIMAARAVAMMVMIVIVAAVPVRLR